MMNFLRKNVKTFLWSIAIAFIGGVFLWNFSTRRLIDCVVQVNGTKVSYSSFLESVNMRIRNWYDQNPQAELSDDQRKEIKSEVLNAFIQEQLLIQEARKYGIYVSQSEVINTIRSLPQFQREGKFDPQLYFYILQNYFRTEPAVYEAQIKQLIINQKVRDFIISTIKVTDQEVKDEYERRKMKEKTEDFKESFLQEKKVLFYRQWLLSLYQKAKIINNLDKIEKGS
ncbi:MAG: SurA N-terminal domain-containing protein [Elusimicrobiota bacterium]|nr:SurA N-terminal domain-containing protein [Elusimicrobiota bacterium]